MQLWHLFIRILKGVAFEWFMKMFDGSINSWGKLEILFLTPFFKDNLEVLLPTLLTTSQQDREHINAFVERFWRVALR